MLSTKLLRPGRDLGLPPGELLAAGGLATCLLWVYWPTVITLAEAWGSNAQYSHGYLVPLFALFLLWSRRDQLQAEPLRPNWWGLALLAGGLALRFAGIYTFLDWLTAVSLLPCLAGLGVLVGGWPVLRWAWPALAFLIFMVPFPFRVEIALAHPLQRIATKASTFSLQTLGFAAFAEGNVIRLGQIRIGVVEACSGLSMLLIFFALSTAVVLLIKRPLLDKAVIFLSAIPIALVCNILRITVTGILHKTAGSELANLVFHDLAGWLMMPLALGLLWVELRLLAWVLIVPATQPEAAPAAAAVPAPVPAPASTADGAPQAPAAEPKSSRRKKRAAVKPVSSLEAAIAQAQKLVPRPKPAEGKPNGVPLPGATAPASAETAVKP
jgi:exosortase